MTNRPDPSQSVERPYGAYRRLFSIAYYESVIEAGVETVLKHGRQLVGLAPLDRDQALTKERMDREFAKAEPFVASRLVRTGMGFITLLLSEEEWSVIADSEQRPYREEAPLDKTGYDREKAAAHAKVRVTSSSAKGGPRTAARN